MDSVKLYPQTQHTTAPQPLPRLLQTPSGLALLELQGSVNLPTDAEGTPLGGVEIGKLAFPDYVPGEADAAAGSSAWMRRVHLYVGQHQRLTGEVRRLPRALAVVRRRADAQAGDLEVVDIIKYRLVFSSRPEPVGTANAP